jgi:hypothetical protein
MDDAVVRNLRGLVVRGGEVAIDATAYVLVGCASASNWKTTSNSKLADP